MMAEKKQKNILKKKKSKKKGQPTGQNLKFTKK